MILGKQKTNQNTILSMIKILNIKSKDFEKKLNYYLSLRRRHSESKVNSVRKIVKDVRKYQDKSIIKYERKFNNIKSLSKKNFYFSNTEIEKNIKKLDNKVKNSIDLAFNRIFSFHKNQKFKGFKIKDSYNNTFSYRSKPISKVGIYVPGGRASYPSSVMMNCIPAIIAGVKEIYMTVPSLHGQTNPGVLYAAKKCKIKKIFKLGGAQAIAAFAFGTQSIQKVDKIVGPGNEYVALAKKEISGISGIDMFAGPSEVTVVADKYSNPEWISADLIAQSEHDEMSQSILISDNQDLIFKVRNLIAKQLKFLPKRKIASSSLSEFGLAILVKNLREASEIINLIAPEHLQIYTRQPNKYLKLINNAGSIFLGPYSPEAIGDYLAGPNHVLPTSGTARFSSGLSVFDFIKRQSVIKISKRGIEKLGPSVVTLSKYENLHGHANSVKQRLKKR